MHIQRTWQLILCLQASLLLQPFALRAQNEQALSEQVSEYSQTHPNSIKEDNHTNTESTAPLQHSSTPLHEQQAEIYSWQDNISRIFSTLLLIITLILISAWVLRKVMQTRIQQVNQSHLIKIISQRPLPPKTNLYVVQVCNKGIVLAESASGVYTLLEIVLEQEKIDAMDQQENHAKTSFRSIMEKVLPKK